MLNNLKECSIVVMPDFFIDRIVRLKSPTKDVFRVIQEKEKFGGGSIRASFWLGYSRRKCS
jgi:hypothetical protein